MKIYVIFEDVSEGYIPGNIYMYVKSYSDKKAAEEEVERLQTESPHSFYFCKEKDLF